MDGAGRRAEAEVAGRDGRRLGRIGGEDAANGLQVAEAEFAVRADVGAFAPLVPCLDQAHLERRTERLGAALVEELLGVAAVALEEDGRAVGDDESALAVPRARVPAAAEDGDLLEQAEVGCGVP